VREVNTDEFIQEIATGTTIVDIWASWCGPCKALGPVLEKVEKEYPNSSFVKSKADQNVKICNQFGVRSLPTLLFFKEGKLIDKIVGGVPKKDIELKIEKHS